MQKNNMEKRNASFGDLVVAASIAASRSPGQAPGTPSKTARKK
jgi:hypothetical protein